MADAPPVEKQFWLLTEEVPSGPFTVAQIHSMLACGKATWQTSASLIGEGTWRPLFQTPGIGPSTEQTLHDKPASSPSAGKSGTRPETSSVHQSPAQSRTPVSPGFEAAVGFAVLVVLGLLGWFGYEWLRPLTATEVCKKLDTIQSPAEAKNYVTTRMYAVIETMLTDPAPSDPNDTFEWTQEVDGPLPNTKRVGFRGTWFDAEAGKRVGVQGHCKVVMSDGWKVDDMVFTGVDGVSLPAPVSLADEVLKSKPPSNPAKPATDANRDRRSRNTFTGLAIAGWALVKGGGLKVIGVFALGVIGAIAAAWRSSKRSV